MASENEEPAGAVAVEARPSGGAMRVQRPAPKPRKRKKKKRR
jgi:hypothetical protein